MELLPQEIRQLLPQLYGQEKKEDQTVYCKFFTPDSNLTWYVLEGSEEEDDFTFFAYVVGQFSELGYASLRELESVRGPFGLPVERDLWFRPCPLSEVKAQNP